ncbi:MAG: hypothetical protein V1944_00960 [Candidatus Aenigmatarchaeota archaeon]
MTFPKLSFNFGKKKEVADYEKDLPPLPAIDKDLPSLGSFQPLTRREVTMESAGMDNIKSKIDLMTTQIENLNIKYENISQKIEQIQRMVSEIYKIAKS